MELEIDEDFFTKIYFEIDKTLQDNSVRFLFIYGGSSSSKTYSFVQWDILYMLQGNANNTLIFRKYSVDIKDSIFADFKQIISDWELSDYFIIQQNFIKCKITGSYTVFKGLDDSEKIKGLTGFKKICMEELNQFELADFKQVRKRLRGKVGQQIIGIFNPVSENSFIKKEIFDKEIFKELPTTIQQKQINATGNMVILKTCYLDNEFIVGGKFVDQHTIDDFEKDRISDNAYYQIYAMGNWGKLRTGGEFFKDFDVNRNTLNTAYRPELPLHLTFDENVQPYLTCNVWQLHNDVLTQIDEIMLPDPKNTLKHTCQVFSERYLAHRSGLFVYGDATSNKKDVKLEKGANFYSLIAGYLAVYRPQFKIEVKNPSVVMSKLFVNNMFAEGQLAIGKNCAGSIYDYQYAQENEDGGMDKKVIKNKETGASYQEFGHASDTLRYICCTMFRKEYSAFINGGKSRTICVG